MLQKWGKGGSIIVIASALFALSLFMPWVEFIVSVNGFQQQGYLVLILFAYPLYTALSNKTINAILGLTSSVIAVIVMFIFLSSKSQEIFGQTVSAASSGLYVGLLASALLVVGVVFKMKDAK